MRTRLLAIALTVVVAATAVLAGGKRSSGTTYIYKRGDSTYISGSVNDLRGLSRFGSEFVLVREGGRHYLIKDRAVLDTIRDAFAESDRLEAPMKELESRLRPHERELERIEARIDALGDQLDDDERLSESKRAAIERDLRRAEEAVQAVEERMRLVEEELERVERKMDAAHDVAEERFEQIVRKAIRDGVAQRIDG